MKKTYWWREVVVIVGIIALGYWYLATSFDTLGLYNSFTKSFALLSLSLFLVSPFLFFVRDEVFLKWLRFSLVWFGVAIVLIAITPEYHAGIFSMMNPTKESVSVLFASLFIPASLLKLLVDSKGKSGSKM